MLSWRLNDTMYIAQCLTSIQWLFKDDLILIISLLLRGLLLQWLLTVDLAKFFTSQWRQEACVPGKPPTGAVTLISLIHPSPRSTRFLWGFALYRHPSSPLEKDIPPLSSSLQTFCLRLSLRLFMKQAAGNCCNALSWSWVSQDSDHHRALC